MKKYNITKEELIDLYINKQLTTLEIGNIFKVDRTTISNKLKSFNILTNSAQRKYKKLKDTPLTFEQKSLIFGSTLGDGSIILSQRRKNAYFKVDHCEKQKDYLFWKRSVLGSLVNTIRKNIDKRQNSIMYSFNTISHKDLNLLRDLLYKDNIKVIKPEIETYLNDLSLAIWFMDDGTKSGKNNYRIATDCFSEEENYILTNILYQKFNIKPTVCKYTRNEKQYYYLHINKFYSSIMTDIIKPYIVECLKYKIINE
jgi:hypothetical protein